ncbi:hypothetical protein AB7645_16980 [Bradyrhizobium sp. 956_D2_N1_5]|uniref:hypothetical protein n=1 Tax=unclassified Bradyrhizobium TaxID=2631580 RepID=UPI003F22E0E0
MKYNIQEAVDFITDKEKPDALRAIKLFALIFALHAGKSEAKITGHAASEQENSLIINVSIRLMRDAELLAAMKFLDHLETEWLASHSGQQPTIQEMAKICEYSQLYNEMILRHGGWKRIRYFDGLRDLEARIEDFKPKAKDVSRIIEFSARFASNPKKSRQKGGVTMGIHILSTKSGRDYFFTRTKKSQLEVNWARLKAAAPFHYLLYVEKHPFVLNAIAGKNFARKWLRRVQDRNRLLEFFAAYNTVAAQLRPRQYFYSPLRLPEDIVSTIAFKPIDAREGAKVLAVIDRYRR